MAWIFLTEADVLTVLSEPELTAYRSKATATGQADPLIPTVAQVTELVRGYVGAHASNRLGPDDTLTMPPSSGSASSNLNHKIQTYKTQR